MQNIHIKVTIATKTGHRGEIPSGQGSKQTNCMLGSQVEKFPPRGPKINQLLGSQDDIVSFTYYTHIATLIVTSHDDGSCELVYYTFEP